MASLTPHQTRHSSGELFSVLFLFAGPALAFLLALFMIG